MSEPKRWTVVGPPTGNEPLIIGGRKSGRRAANAVEVVAAEDYDRLREDRDRARADRERLCEFIEREPGVRVARTKDGDWFVIT